jgi:hypothetical protein
MDWLSNHFWLLFGGVGGTALVALAIFWLERRRRNSNESVEFRDKSSTVTVRDSQLTGSPVASGSQITQHNYFGSTTTQSATPAPTTVAPTEDKPCPNIQMTGTGVVTVLEHDWMWKENELGTNQAVVIQFTNEARQQGRNIGAPVKASMVYKNDGVPVLRIIGSWLYEGREYVEFRVDESHKLLVGVLYNKTKTLVVIERRRVVEESFDNIKPVPHDLSNIQIVSVRLTNANTGDFLYEGDFQVTLDPLAIAHYVTGQIETKQ